MRQRVGSLTWSPPRLRPVFHLVGGMLLALSAAMLLPAIADAIVGNRNWRAFAVSSVITFLCGFGLLYTTRCRLAGGLNLRQAFLLTPLAWTAACGIAN